MEMQPGVKSAETPSAGLGSSKSRSSCLLFVLGVPAALRPDPDSVPSTQLYQHPSIPQYIITMQSGSAGQPEKSVNSKSNAKTTSPVGPVSPHSNMCVMYIHTV